MFAERYADSVNSSNLMDDAFHRKTEALCASALASKSAKNRELGALLMRIKYVDGTMHKDFEGHAVNVAQALRIWTDEVRRKGRDRGWLVPRTEWDIAAAESLYRQVAEVSMAHWLDSRCKTCEGTGVQTHQHACPVCKGSKVAPITGRALVVDRSLEMVSELDGICRTHSSRAAYELRRAA